MSTEAFALAPPNTLPVEETLDHTNAIAPYSNIEVASSHQEDADEILIGQIGEGNRNALCLIFQRYARPVRNVAYRILRNQQEAEDLVQDVFLHIFKKATLFNPDRGHAGSWIIHLAYQQALNRRRYLTRRHFYHSSDLDDAAMRRMVVQTQTPASATTIQDVLGKTLAHLYEQRLSTEQRRVIELYFFAGHTFDEVVEVTGMSMTNVRNHYYRGLDRLRRYVLQENTRSQ